MIEKTMAAPTGATVPMKLVENLIEFFDLNETWVRHLLKEWEWSPDKVDPPCACFRSSYDTEIQFCTEMALLDRVAHARRVLEKEELELAKYYQEEDKSE